MDRHVTSGWSASGLEQPVEEDDVGIAFRVGRQNEAAYRPTTTHDAR